MKHILHDRWTNVSVTLLNGWNSPTPNIVFMTKALGALLCLKGTVAKNFRLKVFS
jgi:hypothetical protein